MTQEPEQTTGTPEQDDGDAAESSQTAGTPASEGRDAEREPDYKALHLANKDTIATLTAKVAELAEKVGSQPATEPAQERGNTADIDKLLAEAERLKAVDPVAALMLSERAERLQDRQDFSDALVLARLPEAKQKATLDFYMKNRHRFADLAAAAEALNGREASSRIAQLEKERDEALKKAATGEPRVNRDDVVRTHGVDTSTPTHKARSYTQEQYDDEYARLEREGGIRATLELQGKLRRGEILLKR